MVLHRRKIQSGHRSGHHRWLFTGGRFNQDIDLVITGGYSLEEDSLRTQTEVITGGCSLKEYSIRTQIWSSQVVIHWRKILSGYRLRSSQVVLHRRKIQSGHRSGHHRWLFTGGRFNQDIDLVITGGYSLEEDSIRTQTEVITGGSSLEEDSIKT